MSSETYEDKMLSLTMGNFDLLRLLTQESISLRLGMGIPKNSFNQPEMNKTIFGRK